MTADRSRIEYQLQEVRERIAAVAGRAGRRPEDIRLVAVTKSVGVSEIRVLLELGVTHLGENRVDQAAQKIAEIGAGPTWHMIGNIQRRKARDVVALFDRADAVDRVSLAETLEQRCADSGKQLPILIEVNVSGEEAKHGFAPGELEDALAEIGAMEHLHVEGLMTMGATGCER